MSEFQSSSVDITQIDTEITKLERKKSTISVAAAALAGFASFCGLLALTIGSTPTSDDTGVIFGYLLFLVGGYTAGIAIARMIGYGQDIDALRKQKEQALMSMLNT
ncbi:MAG: hypothetical protein LBU61_02730 [Coriobacteriales bacterium]|nr:hypothetical protein [Coriobacteriales bacterium]